MKPSPSWRGRARRDHPRNGSRGAVTARTWRGVGEKRGWWGCRIPFVANTGHPTGAGGSAGILLMLLLLAGRLLSVADYGRFSFALSLTTIVETIMDVGLGHVTVRAV